MRLPTFRFPARFSRRTAKPQRTAIPSSGWRALRRCVIPLCALLAAPLLANNPIPGFVGTSGLNQGATGFDANNLANTTLDAADPVNMATGEFYFTKRLLGLDGPLPLSFGIAYSSGGGAGTGGVETTPQGLGGMAGNFRRSHHAFVQRVNIDFGPGFQFTQAFVRMGLEEDLAFQLNTTTSLWEQLSDKAERHELIETATHYYVSDPASGTVHIFVKAAGEDAAPRTHVVDRNGNTLTYTLPAVHDDATITGPLSVSDGLGRTLTFGYTTVAGVRMLTSVTDHTGRAWTFQYENNPADNPPAPPPAFPPGGVATPLVTLRSITDPLGGVCAFTYQGANRIAAKQMPRGNTPYSQTYSATLTDRAVQTQTDALGRVFTFASDKAVIGLGDTHRVITHPDGSQRHFFHGEQGTLMTGILDEAGKYMSFEADPGFRAIAKTVDRDGAKSSITYDEASGFVKSITNARGDTSTATFTPVVQTITNPANAETVNVTFFDLTRVDHVDGTFSTFAYDTKGNATGSTDRDGDTTTRTFNTRGQTLTRTNPEGGVTTFTYNAAARLATSTDTDTGVTSYGYDTLNRLSLITRPDTSTAAFTYDALDRPLTRTDERGTMTKFDYDANDNLTAVTRDFGGALAQATALEYDALDRLVKTTDPAGHARRFDYPYHERVSKITHPDGTTTRFEYDARRALAAVVDEAGKRADFERDEVEQLIKATSPEGRIATLERDPLGDITARIDHTGDRTAAELDEFSRVTATTDPLGRKKSVVRDGEGRVTSRTEPVSGGTEYEYDDNGRLTKLTDVRGKEWLLTYTTMGRLDTLTDPNGEVWDYNYDSRGRVSTILHPDGVTETRVYDAESNLTARNFSDGLELEVEFDALDRVTAQSKAAQSAALQIGYDVRNNVTTTTLHGQTFTATHDARSRLSTLNYAGQMTVTYTYDARGLVTRVTDSLTGAQVEIAYNDDRQMTQVTRSNGVVTAYAYDAEGKIATIQHGALGTIGFTFNAANEPTAITDTGFPVDGGAFLTSASVETLTFDDANQITTVGHIYDDRGRPTADGTRTFTWDSADRLIGVVNGGSTLAYDYLADGRIASRTLNGQATDYSYADSVATRPILAERKAGAFTRFYIALPNGRLLYQIDLNPTPAVRFYHFGKVGETRFLTDAAGAVTDAYAYDGYGRLLGKTGASDQLYRFVGEQGVRHDPEAGLVHMRARHYDPASGRFLSRDPIHLALMGRNSQQANPYHYVQGMATWVTDPSGLDAFNRHWFGSAEAQGNWDEVNDINPPRQGMGAGDAAGGEVDGDSNGNGIFEIAIQAQRAIDVLESNGAELSDAERGLILQGTVNGLVNSREARLEREKADADIANSKALAKALKAKQEAERRAAAEAMERAEARLAREQAAREQLERERAALDARKRQIDEEARDRRIRSSWFNFFFPMR